MATPPLSCLAGVVRKCHLHRRCWNEKYSSGYVVYLHSYVRVLIAGTPLWQAKYVVLNR